MMNPQPASKPLIIVKLGSAPASVSARFGDYEQHIAALLADSGLPLQIVRAVDGEALPDYRQIAGAVLTGSPSMVGERKSFSETVRGWLQQAVPAGLPVFGICYGHQLLADTFGGEVGANPNGLEIGTIPLERQPACDGDPLFAPLPPHLCANATHFQSVLKLPAGGVALLANRHDAHQAYRYGKNAWGVQFHPEFTAPLMQAMLELRRQEPAAAGRDTDAEIAAVRDSADAAGILRRFAAFVREHQEQLQDFQAA